MIVKHQCYIVQTPDPKWLTAIDAAEILGMTYEQLAYKMHFGKISYYARTHTRPTKRWVSFEQAKQFARDNNLVNALDRLIQKSGKE